MVLETVQSLKNRIISAMSGQFQSGLPIFKTNRNTNWNLEVHMIGNIVTVKVDRPMGSYHPEHKDMYYPMNYGYIEGIIAPDGEEQDAYLLGLDEPVQEYTGTIIAIIHRYDDVEEKWVVAPKGMIFTKEEIKEQTYFQEQYFKSEIRM